MSRPHHHHLVAKMAQKGWSKEELEHAYQAMEEVKHQHRHRLIHWILFFVIIFGNMITVAALLPLLVIFPNPALYGILIVMGVAFGFLCMNVISHINHLLEAHHHFIIGIIIPVVAVVTGVLIINQGIQDLPNLLGVDRNPLVIGIVYALAFVLPYFIMVAIHKFYK